MSEVRYLKSGLWVLGDGTLPISPGTQGPDTPLPPPPVTPTFGLTHWTNSLNNRDTAPAKVLTWGNSRTEGERATTLAKRWQDVLAANFRAAFPTAGVTNYCPHNYVPVSYISTSLATLGEWTNKTLNSTPNNYGLGTRVVTMIAAGQGATLNFTGTSCKIAYTRTNTASSFTVKVDTGAAQTVSWPAGAIAGSQLYTITGLTRGAHTVDVRWASGTNYIEGAHIYDGEAAKGIQFYDGGHSGTRSGNTYGAGTQYVTQAVATVDPDLIIFGIGTNDYGSTAENAGNINPATYKTNMKNMIAAFKAGCTSVPSIILTLDWKRGATWGPYTWDQYLNALREIAAEDPDACITLFDLQASFPPNTDNSKGYYHTDLVHETDIGQAERARLLQALITPTGSDPFVPNQPQFNPELPFELEPLRKALHASARTVWTHYFPPYPIMLDVPQALPDYYDRNYLNPAWSTYGTVGGFLRDRPPRRAILPGTTAEWKTADMLTEVQRAYSMGLDGFALEILGISGQNWDFGNYLVSAIKQFANPNFRFFPQPDGTASGTTDPTALGNALSTLLASPYAYKLPNGHHLVSPFGPERAPVKAGTWGTTGWGTVKTAMAAKGFTADFWMCYVASWTYSGSGATRVNGAADTFDSISYGHGRWGDRDPVTNNSGSINTGGAVAASHSRYNKPFMYPVSIQDTRPPVANGQKYWEAKNTENFRATWMAAINNGAELVLIPTWNDYSENAHLSPSVNQGNAYGDICSYYVCWYKLGSPPKIVRDCLYLTHRNQWSDPAVMTFTSGQTAFQKLNGQTPASDNAEVLCFLTAPSTVTLRIGTTVSTFNAPAGVNAFSAPIKDGQVVATATRNGQTIASVTTGVAISHTQVNQNLGYFAASSLR